MTCLIASILSMWSHKACRASEFHWASSSWATSAGLARATKAKVVTFYFDPPTIRHGVGPVVIPVRRSFPCPSAAFAAGASATTEPAYASSLKLRGFGRTHRVRASPERDFDVQGCVLGSKKNRCRCCRPSPVPVFRGSSRGCCNRVCLRSVVGIRTDIR